MKTLKNARFFIDKAESIKAFMAMAFAYNEEFYYTNAQGERCVKWDGSRLLKKPHFDAYEVILFLLVNKNRTSERCSMDDLTSVATSRQEILNLYSQKYEAENFRPVNPTKITIWRHIQRLIDAKVILSKSRVGGTQLFKLRINPEVLKISDLDLRSNEKLQTGSQTALYPEKVSNLNLYQPSKQKTEKSNAYAVDKAETGQKPDGCTQTPKPTKTANTGKDPKISAGENGARPDFPQKFFDQKQRIQELIEKEENRYRRSVLMVEREKYNTVFELYRSILGTVFTEKLTYFRTHGDLINYPFRFVQSLPMLNIHAEHDEALRVLLSYFNKAQSFSEIELMQQHILKAAQLARRAILRNRTNIDFLTPSRFLKQGRFSLANVYTNWLPNYYERERKKAEKIANDQCTIEEARTKAGFLFEADLLLREVLENSCSIAKAVRYIDLKYSSTFKNWFVELVEKSVTGEYEPTAKAKNKTHKELIEKVFHYEEYIIENQQRMLTELNRYMKKRTYTNTLSEALVFKDPMVQANPVGVRDLAYFEDFAYRKLLFN